MPHWLKQRAHLTPNRIAYVTDDEKVTFLELDNQVKSLAMKLISYGVQEGQRVALLFNNTLDFVRMYHAFSYIGAISVPLNTRLTLDEWSWQCQDADVHLLIGDPAHDQMGEQIQRLLPSISYLSLDLLTKVKENKTAELKEYLDLSQIHTIIYTSGTTGHPKGVLLTYGNHWWSAIGSVLNLGLDTNDKWLCCVPLFHVSGLSILMKNVIYGMTVRLFSSFDASKINLSLQKEDITAISVVTTMLIRMLDHLGEESYSKSLRCVLLGGGHAPKVILEKCHEKGIPVYQTYGLTESASQIITLSPEYMVSKLGSAGKSLFPTECKIIKDRREALPMEEGEIVVKGPNVTIGYLKNEKATEEVLKDGWLFTGDIGYKDHDGFVYVLDRRKDLIISGGENIYPAEIEALLLRHPNIEEAGVIGIEDSKWGQVPVAFVKLKNSEETLDEIQNFCKKYLASYKVPKQFHAISKLPRNASNKLLRRKLYDLLSHINGK
ncbi:o-succinylbenzoate--CoA ligase [Terrilactibacillus sp. BCM23-1]|uniref:2-succinylbenzoate--CoA ligase n=1 Tax=Terrilactibacillus tamarindi TaxID=2599694 RepID=A0A6N8CM60_9BACI|nr:o-succinylbenzoate--CoA ligase [Terrilactibacillus tamarindi]MTT30520.1 o-succinylbenzoate--CoA ligase [Terrilactibacillus tamarindi]